MDFTTEALKVISKLPPNLPDTTPLNSALLKSPLKVESKEPKEPVEKVNLDITYEKVRWPLYREVCLKRRNILCLPQQSKHLRKMVGLRDQNIVHISKSQPPRSAQQTVVPVSSAANVSQNQKLVLEGKNVEIGGTELVKFDGSFECANVEQVRQRELKVFDVWIRNDTNGTNAL